MHFTASAHMLDNWFNPICVVSATVVATTVATFLDEADVEWIHTIWVVIACALLVDMEPDHNGRMYRVIRKTIAVIVGLAIGIALALVLKVLYSWVFPRWTILALRIVFECVIFFAAAVIVQRLNPVAGYTSQIEPTHLVLVCLTAMLPLFSPKSSVALCRIAACLLTSVFVLAITSAFVYLRIWLEAREGHSKSKRIVEQHKGVIESTLRLCSVAIGGKVSDKEIVEQVSSEITAGLTRLDHYGIRLVVPFSKRKTSRLFASEGTQKIIETLVARIRPISFECYSVYWSVVAASATPFLHSELSIKTCVFTDTPEIFSRHFEPSLKKLVNGIDNLRDNLLELVTRSTSNITPSLLERICDENVGYEILEGVQGLEFNFAQLGPTPAFCSLGQRWNMCMYLVNVSAVVLSLIGLVDAVVEMCAVDVSEARRSLGMSMRRISELQKNGSFNDLLSLANPIVGSQRTSGTHTPV
jgi:hypothetical protein